MNKKIIITRPEGHYSLLENSDDGNTLLVEKNLRFRFTLSTEGIVCIEDAVTGRTFDMRNN